MKRCVFTRQGVLDSCAWPSKYPVLESCRYPVRWRSFTGPEDASYRAWMAYIARDR